MDEVIRVIDLVPGIISSLECVDADQLTPSVFWNNYVLKHKPVIIRRGASDWPAVSRWSEAGYLEGIPSSVQTRLTRTFNPMPYEALLHAMQDCNIQDGLREMRAAPDNATYSMPAIPVPVEWEMDLGEYSFLPPRFARKPRYYPRQRLFVYRNASTEWHYHSMDETLTTQLSGAKRISLLKLDANNWSSYKTVITSNLHHMTCRNRFFPDSGLPRKYEGILEKGDVVYIPPYWWHGIDPNDSSLGVTLAFCFRSPVERLGSWSDPATRAMLSNDLRAMPRNLVLICMITFSSIMRLVKGIDQK